MDSVVALAAMSADLQTSRIHSVDAKISTNNPPAGAMAGGYLAAKTTVQLGESSDGDEVISSIVLKVEGFPKGIVRENAKTEDRIFCIEVTAQGVYSWGKKPPDSAIQHADLAHALGRPVYAIAANEVRSLAVKMGFMGVYIESDLPRAQADGDKARPMQKPSADKSQPQPAAKQRSYKKPPTAKVAAKRIK